MKTYKGDITELKDNQIFVFGSNTEGRHGLGSALIAKEKFGAIQGQSEGLQGQSYAIITKDLTKKKHPSRTKEQIIEQIKKLYDFAKANPDKEFLVAYTISKNLNAYSFFDMAEMFSSMDIPDNILFNERFAVLVNAKTVLKKHDKINKLFKEGKKIPIELTKNLVTFPINPYNELRKKYTDEEIAESFILPSEEPDVTFPKRSCESCGHVKDNTIEGVKRCNDCGGIGNGYKNWNI